MTAKQAGIVAAVSTEHLEQLYRLRAQVFLGEQILQQPISDRLTDCLDSTPATTNFVALANGRVVGGCRVTVAGVDVCPAITPMHDFSPCLGPKVATTASGSMLCIDPKWRRGATLGLSLVATCMTKGLDAGMTHVCAAVRPAATPLFERLGWRAVGACYQHETEHVPVVPMVTNLRQPSATFERFLRRSSSV